MKLSEELIWRGFLEQTTYKDPSVVDNQRISFYWGVDPSADSMHIGNLATAMLVKHLMVGGHKAVLLVGGATGLVGDPDGKGSERELQSPETIASNKQAISEQYKQLFSDQQFEIVDNYDWFKDIKYLDFLRDVGKHVPMRQMLGREFVQTRLNDSGISYAEFSYVLIQAYDFLTLFRDKNVTLQLAGSDQWGNSIAGVDLIRRLTGKSADVWTSPLIIDKTTGKKFGKTETGAIWLDPKKTSPTAFYQFWINVSDDNVEDYLKIYTMLSKEEIDELVQKQNANRKHRLAQKTLATEVTKLVHGDQAADLAAKVTAYLTGEASVSSASNEEIEAVRNELPVIKVNQGDALASILVASGLAKSNTEARSLIESKAIYLNGQPATSDKLEASDLQNGRTLIRRGKAFRDSALLET